MHGSTMRQESETPQRLEMPCATHLIDIRPKEGRSLSKNGSRETLLALELTQTKDLDMGNH